VYVTFILNEGFNNKKRIAVKVKNQDELQNVGYDAISLVGISNVRTRISKPYNVERIITVQDYFENKY